MDAKSRREANLDAGKRKLEEFRRRKLEKQKIAKQALDGAPAANNLFANTLVDEIAYNIEEPAPGSRLEIEEIDELPAVTVSQEPPTIFHDPPTVVHPTIVDDPLTIVHEPPTIIYEPPTIVHETPTTILEPPTIVHEPPTIVYEPPNIVEPPTEENLKAHLAAQSVASSSNASTPSKPRGDTWHHVATDATPKTSVVTDLRRTSPEVKKRNLLDADSEDVAELSRAEDAITIDFHAVQAELTEVKAQLACSLKEQASLDELRRRLDVTDAQKTALAAELEKLTHQTSLEADTTDALRIQTERQAKDAQARVEALVVEANEARGLVTELQRSLATVESNTGTQIAEQASKMQEAEAQASSLSTQLASAEAEMVSLRDAAEQAQSHVQALEAARIKTEAELADLTDTKGEVQEQIATSRQQVADLQLEVDEATRQADVVSEQRVVLELELSTKFAALQESAAREAKLHAELDANEQKLIGVNVELKSLTVKLAAVESDSSSSLEGLQSEVTTVQAEIKALRVEKEALEAEHDQVQTTLDSQSAMVEELEFALVETQRVSEDNLRQSQARIEGLQMVSSAAEAKVEAAEGQLAATQVLLEHALESAAAAKAAASQVALLEQEVEALKEARASAKEQKQRQEETLERVTNGAGSAQQAVAEQLKAKDEQVAGLKEKLAKAVGKGKAILAERKQAAEDLAIAQKELAKVQAQGVEARVERTTSHSDLAAAHAELASTQAAAQGDVMMLEAELDSKVSLLEAAGAALESERAAMAATLHEVQAELLEARAEAEGLRHDLADAKAEVAEKEAITRQAQARAAELEAEVHQGLARAEAHAEELEHKQAALVKAVQKGKELHLLKKQVDVHAAEKEALLAAAEARAAHAEEANAEAQREKEVGAGAAGQHVAELESCLRERDAHQEELEARLQEASAYSALLGEREAQARVEAEAARARVTELEGQLEGLTGEMSLLTHAAERSHARQHTLQQDLQAAQADLAEVRASSEVAAAVEGVAKVDLAAAEFGADLEAAKKAAADNKEKLTKAVKKGKAIEREKRALEVKLEALMLEMAPPNGGEDGDSNDAVLTVDGGPEKVAELESVVAELRRAAEGAGDSEAAVAAAKTATQEYKEKLTKAVRKGRALEEERNRALEAVEALRQRAASPGAVMGSPPVRTTVDLQCASLEADLNVARQQLEWLQEANDKVVKATREDLQEHRQRVADLQQEVDEATRQADVASEAHAVQELELGNKLAALQEISAREATFQADLKANEQKLIDVNAELKSLTVKLAAVESDGSASREGLQSEVTAVQAEIKALREEKEAVEAEHDQVQTTLDSQSAKVEELEAALVETRRHVDDNQLQSQARIQELQTAASIAEAKVETAEEQLAGAASQVALLEREVVAMKEAGVTAEEQIQRYQETDGARSAEQEASMQRAAVVVEELEKDSVVLHSQLADMRGQVETVETQMAAVVTQVEEAKVVETGLRQELQTARASGSAQSPESTHTSGIEVGHTERNALHLSSQLEAAESTGHGHGPDVAVMYKSEKKLRQDLIRATGAERESRRVMQEGEGALRDHVFELEAKLASGGEGAEALALRDNIERAQAAVAEACVRLREAEAAKEALTQHLQLAQTQLATAEAGAGGEVGSLVTQLKEARAETMERELEMAHLQEALLEVRGWLEQAREAAALEGEHARAAINNEKQMAVAKHKEVQEALRSELRLALSAQEELSAELSVKEAALREAHAGMVAAAAREAQERGAMEVERGLEGTQAEEAREAEVKMTEDTAEALAAAEEQAYELEGLLDRSEAKVTQLEREMVAVQSRLYTDVRTKEDDLAAATKQVTRLERESSGHKEETEKLQAEMEKLEVMTQQAAVAAEEAAEAQGAAVASAEHNNEMADKEIYRLQVEIEQLQVSETAALAAAAESEVEAQTQAQAAAVAGERSAADQADSTSAALAAAALRVADLEAALAAGALQVSELEAALAAGALRVSDLEAALAAGALQVSEREAALAAGHVRVSDLEAALAAGACQVAELEATLEAGALGQSDLEAARTAGSLQVSALEAALEAAQGLVEEVRVKAKAAVGSKAGMLKEATSMLEGAVTRAEAAEQRVVELEEHVAQLAGLLEKKSLALEEQTLAVGSGADVAAEAALEREEAAVERERAQVAAQTMLQALEAAHTELEAAQQEVEAARVEAAEVAQAAHESHRGTAMRAEAMARLEETLKARAAEISQMETERAEERKKAVSQVEGLKGATMSAERESQRLQAEVVKLQAAVAIKQLAVPPPPPPVFVNRAGGGAGGEPAWDPTDLEASYPDAPGRGHGWEGFRSLRDTGWLELTPQRVRPMLCSIDTAFAKVGRVMRAHPLTRFALLFYLTVIHLMITFQLAWITTHTKVGGYDDAVDTAAIDLSDRLI